jgi:hypothetical protein
MPFIDNELYNDIALSERLGGKPAPATLAKWRMAADGPRFVLVGRSVFYRGSDINAWLQARTVSHTNQPIAKRKPRARPHRPIKRTGADDAA